MEHTPEIDLNQRRLRALIQNLTDVITIHGADGTTLFESPSAARVLGYGTDGLIGRTPFEAIHPKDVESVRNVFAHLLGGDLAPKPIEFRYRHAQGRWIVLRRGKRNVAGVHVERGPCHRSDQHERPSGTPG